MSSMWDAAESDRFRSAVLALTRRRIEIYRDAGETWRFAESLKSVSEDTAQEYEGRTILELVQNGHDAIGDSAPPGRIAVLAVPPTRTTGSSTSPTRGRCSPRRTSAPSPSWPCRARRRVRESATRVSVSAVCCN
ncbi:hypothetical protein GTV15_22685 [Streptomyces sp. SID7803]|nr:hypothetical protein [Streptomyces sp. SID7803]